MIDCSPLAAAVSLLKTYSRRHLYRYIVPYILSSGSLIAQAVDYVCTL